MQFVFIGLMGICAIHDLRSRKIPAIWIWICIGSMCIYRIYMILQGKSNIVESVACILPGIFLLVLSHISRHVGNGDGWILIASGLYLSATELPVALVCAFMAAGLFSAGCLVFTKKGKNTPIPFVPFLFAGVVIACLGNLA